MTGLDYFVRQATRYSALTEVERKRRPSRFGSVTELYRFVTYMPEGRPDLTLAERIELASLRRELKVLLPT